MVEVVVHQRKPPILTPSAIPCLRGLPTVNITEGCALGCTYCYIQGYTHYPGPNRIVLFENTPEVLAAELAHKRRKPRRVYFSPSSDAFQYLPQVQDVSQRSMQVLLSAGIEVAFLTKGFVKREFLGLFRAHAPRVFAQVGITTLDRRLWRTFEPRTAPPEKRVATIRSLLEIGVHATARLDPLIPDLTDTDANILPLLEALHRAGVRQVAASYLFLRPAFAARLMAQLRSTVLAGVLRSWTYQRFAGDCAGGTMVTLEERRRRFSRLSALAESIGIRINPCRCKNPELAASGCEIAGPTPELGAGSLSQQMLPFDAAQNRR